MANVVITAIVPPPGSPNPQWTYLVGASAAVSSGDQILTIPQNSSPTIIFTLVAGGSLSDNCVFPTADQLTFANESGSTPGWFQNPQLSNDSSTLTFTDDNTSQNAGTFNMFVNALYNGQPLQSPDPTIVNEGTNGSAVFQLPVPALVAHPQPQLAAVAV
jgi:hypothetical protein